MEGYQYFLGTSCLSLQGRTLMCPEIAGCPKHWYMATKLHSFTCKDLNLDN